jgi:hypothetical protein
MDVLNKSGLQTQISYIKAYVNNQLPANFIGSGDTASAGLVPAPPKTAGTTKYLREDGTWHVPTMEADEALSEEEILEAWNEAFTI